MKLIRVERGSYGTRVWLGSRVRFGSPGTMTPMWPHVYRSGDEYCNDVLAFHLYPLIAVDIWWRWRQRTPDMGMCDECLSDLAEAGLSAERIEELNAEHKAKWLP